MAMVRSLGHCTPKRLLDVAETSLGGRSAKYMLERPEWTSTDTGSLQSEQLASIDRTMNLKRCSVRRSATVQSLGCH